MEPSHSKAFSACFAVADVDADGLDGLSAVSSSRRGARRAGHPPTPPSRSVGCRTWGNLRKSEPFGGSKPRACICIETSLLLLAMILKAQISGFKAEKKILKFHQMAAERKRMAESWCFPKSVTSKTRFPAFLVPGPSFLCHNLSAQRSLHRQGTFFQSAGLKLKEPLETWLKDAQGATVHNDSTGFHRIPPDSPGLLQNLLVSVTPKGGIPTE